MLDGIVCGWGNTGTFSLTGVPNPGVGDFLWWVVLANDAAATEGSWGVDSSAQERAKPGAGGASAQCGKTAKDLSNACGR